MVLDEPTAGLDPIGAAAIMNLFKEMNDAGTTIILVTHDMDLVLKYCDKVFVIDHGQIASQGNPNEVFSTLKEDSSIEVPTLFSLCRKLNEQGYHIDASKIKNIDDFINAVAAKEVSKK